MGKISSPFQAVQICYVSTINNKRYTSNTIPWYVPKHLTMEVLHRMSEAMFFFFWEGISVDLPGKSHKVKYLAA